MRLFNCTNCGQLLYFENSHCEQCGLPLGFIAEELTLIPVVKKGDHTYRIHNRDEVTIYRYCKNHEYNVCNWMVPDKHATQFCIACTFNRTIPNLSNPAYRQRWNVIENGKHRLVYQLLRMQLPLISKIVDPAKGLLFDFLADDETNGEKKILTGHDNGIITLNISEA
ncbi:MAG: zinc-ribbon domain-containing protein, partial [Bacteroidota bacterium]|nr:zinc-ribbon domain-containing protein [Bacteroidota bacterium]